MATLEEARARMEPCLLDETSPAILDLVASLDADLQRLTPKGEGKK